MLDIVGIEIPKVMQGKSLCQLLNNQQIPRRNDFLIEHLFEYPTMVKTEALRTERWKYIRYLVTDAYYEQLYNLETDPFEINNLAKNKEYNKKLEKFRNRCNELINHCNN